MLDQEMTRDAYEDGPFAITLSMPHASNSLAWSVAGKCAATHHQLRLHCLPGPGAWEATELPSPRDVVLWFAATPELRSDAVGDPKTPSIGQARALLDDDESSRLRRFLHAEDRMSYLAAHAGARLLLGAILRRPPGLLRFERSAQGKPSFLDNPAGLDFSLSHARGVVAVAAACFPVGIDIEPLRQVADLEDISEIVLAADERRILAKTPAALRSHLFLRYWTLKEAILKAAGTGFNIAPNTLTVDAGPSPTVLSVPPALGSPSDWRLIAPAA